MYSVINCHFEVLIASLLLSRAQSVYVCIWKGVVINIINS